jgi:hypothetical protein
MRSKKAPAPPRRLADELLQSMDEIIRWAQGEKVDVRVRVYEVPPKPARPTRIKLPGGGEVSVALPNGAGDPAEHRRKIARIRRAVLKAVAEE